MKKISAVHENILKAAERSFRAQGFQGASLTAIARAARLTKGAVYSNFRDKDDLLLAVMERRVTRSIARFRLKAADRASTVEFMADTLARAAVADAPWSTVFAEFALHASRRPRTAKALAAMRGRLRTGIIDLLKPIVDGGDADEARLERAATLFFAISNGLTLERLSDPRRVDADLYREALTTLLRASSHAASRR